MRSVLLILLLTVGCGSKKKDDGGGGGGGTTTPPPAADAAVAGSGSATGSGSAAGSGSAVAEGPPCVKPAVDNELTAFEHTDDKSVTFCVDNGPVRSCYHVDLASGTMTTAKPPPEHPKPEYHAEQDDKGARVCKGAATGDACTKLELPPIKSEAEGSHIYGIDIKPDGKLVAAAGGGDLIILDGATGKKLKQVKVAAGDHKCVAHPVFIGDSIYVTADVCSGPGAQGYVYAGDGKQLGIIKAVNVYGSDPVLVDGTTYAVAEFNGGSYAEFDAKTGKTLRTVKVERPADCENCDDILGDASGWGVTPLLKVGTKIVTISGVVAVTDPASGKVEKTIKIPTCK
jgi:hypothetical protein